MKPLALRPAAHLVLALSACLVACSSSQGPDPSSPGSPTGSAPGPSASAHAGHEEHGPHHHDLAGGMKAFHDVLAPPYHMAVGPERVDKTCGAVAAMRLAATQLASEPKGEAAKWKVAAKSLADGVEALDKACQAKGRPDVGAKLEVVHDGFHALMDLSKG